MKHSAEGAIDTLSDASGTGEQSVATMKLKKRRDDVNCILLKIID